MILLFRLVGIKDYLKKHYVIGAKLKEACLLPRFHSLFCLSHNFVSLLYFYPIWDKS